MNNKGKRLDDFVNSPEARLAGLKKHHAAALRLYTTNSFRKLNDPLRKRVRPHPFKFTVFFLTHGLKRLRKVQAKLDPAAFAAKQYLWRGLSNMTLSFEKFKR